MSSFDKAKQKEGQKQAVVPEKKDDDWEEKEKDLEMMDKKGEKWGYIYYK